MTRKPLNLAPGIARAFEGHEGILRRGQSVQADKIALRQLHSLKEFQGPREKALRQSNVKAMFLQMRTP
jgi:hypothetical protein